MGRMVDLEAAATFMATHARLLDRRRFDLAIDGGPPDGVLAALAAYRNPDGGFGWALEPDQRSPTSQPAGAFPAFDVFEEIAPDTSPLTAELCDWLSSVTLPDGGLPFSLPGAATPGTSAWWAGADTTTSSLQTTSGICGAAHRVRAHDASVGDHPWLQRATEYCLRAATAMEQPGGTLAFRFLLQFLDATVDVAPEAARELERLAKFIPASGEIPVQGGLEGEKLTPLDFAPVPGRPLHGLLSAEAIEKDLDRLTDEQRDDGGWVVDWAISSPAAELEWRGSATVRAVRALGAYGRLG
jgi:hypothetical protein